MNEGFFGKALRPFGAVDFSPPSGPPDPSREEAMSDHIRALEEQIETLQVAADEAQTCLKLAEQALGNRNAAKLFISAAETKLKAAFERL